MDSLFERACAGDIPATERLVGILHPRLVRMAGYYARCTGEDADDLLQEAWLGLLEALPALDLRIGSPEQYLIQHARWSLLDAIKRARVRRCVPLDEEMLEKAAFWPESPFGLVCARDFARRLTITQQAVLDCLLNGLTWREAARVLGCTSANVAYHVRQIRQQYRLWNG